MLEPRRPAGPFSRPLTVAARTPAERRRNNRNGETRGAKELARLGEEERERESAHEREREIARGPQAKRSERGRDRHTSAVTTPSGGRTSGHRLQLRLETSHLRDEPPGSGVKRYFYPGDAGNEPMLAARWLDRRRRAHSHTHTKFKGPLERGSAGLNGHAGGRAWTSSWTRVGAAVDTAHCYRERLSS